MNVRCAVCGFDAFTTRTHVCGSRLCWSCSMQVDDDVANGERPRCACPQVLTLF
jgi:hypothetical protein